LRYEVTKVSSEFKDYVAWDNVSNNNYQSPGVYTLISKEEGVTMSKPVVFNLPTSKTSVSEVFSGTTTIFKDGKEIGTLNLMAQPTNFLQSAYFSVMNALTVETSIQTEDERLNGLFEAKGMSGMLGTIWLILCAMTFGGVMDAIGALAKISSSILNLFDSVFGLFASTVFCCITLNATASDQYLAIVVPGKMYAKAFKDKGLAPENLSRTLEDAGTVTSALVPWNTGGAYQSGVLGVSVHEYFVYAIFNWLSPIMTLLFAAFKIKLKNW